MALGISFIPGQGSQQQQPLPNAQSAPLQQALQMISLRVPRFGSAGAILPQQLLQQQPGGLVPGTPEWDELMKRLMGGMPAMPTPPSQPGGALPAPPPTLPGPGWKYGPGGPTPAPGPIYPPSLPTFDPTPMPGMPGTPGITKPGPGGLTKTFDPYPDQKSY